MSTAIRSTNWDKWMQHAPTALEVEISHVRAELAKARQAWAWAVLTRKPERVTRLLDLEIEELGHTLERLRVRLPMKRQA